jgi:hypothetical protein
MPTVSPGCVTDPAKAAGIPVHINSTLAAAAPFRLLFIPAPYEGEEDEGEENENSRTA